jgi:hypothetical protein
MIKNLTGTSDIKGSTLQPSSQASSSTTPTSTGANSLTESSSQAASETTQDSAVSISGEALMLSRLYMTSNPKATPYLTELSKTTMASNPVDFLTQDDRDFLSQIYTYAQSQGVDLRYVDDLANDMGMYRKFGNAQISSNTPGASFNEQGQALTYSFTQDDSVSASNILNGQAIGSTQFDKAFLRFELDPGYSFNHTANFSFLQGVVEHFSKTGTSDSTSFASKFSTYTSNGLNNFVVTTASEVTLAVPKPSSDGSQSNAQVKSKQTGSAGSHGAVNLEATKLNLATTLLDAFLAWRRKNDS